MFGTKYTYAKARRTSHGRMTPAKVQKIIDKRLETKFACNEYSQLDILGTPFFDELTNIGQGATEGTRIGVHINPTYLELKIGFVGLASSAFAAGAFIRCMVVQTKGDPLTVSDMPAAYGECPDFDIYNVFLDRLITMNTVGGDISSNDPVQYAWTYQKVLLRQPGVKQDITYNGTAGAAQSGGIYVFVIASDADVDIDDGYGLIKYKDG